MSNQNQYPTLFDQQPESSTNQAEILSPSEQFMIAHPDYVEPARPVIDWDPNERRSSRLKVKGAGGGFSAAIDGELQETVTPVSIKKVTPVTVSKRSTRRNYEPRSGDSERDCGTPDYYSEPVLPTEEEKQIGTVAIQKIRAEQAERARLKSVED